MRKKLVDEITMGFVVVYETPNSGDEVLLAESVHGPFADYASAHHWVLSNSVGSWDFVPYNGLDVES